MIPLADRYDAFILDLDGVVYRGDEPVPGAAETVAELRRRGRGVVFLTNNSAPTTADYTAKLGAMGMPAEVDDVLTSAQAAAELLAPGATALVCAGPGVVPRRSPTSAGGASARSRRRSPSPS